MQSWNRFLLTVIGLGTVATLAACSTPGRDKVNLFEASDYLMTKPGETITVPKQGVWLSRDAVNKLQAAGCLP